MDLEEDTVVIIGEPQKKEPESLQPEWANPPSVEDLKTDLQEAEGEHDTQTSKIDGYLDKLYIRNGEKLPASKTHSTIQPKLIRKNAEWRYSALSEPFLSTPDLFSVSPRGPSDKAAAQQNEYVINYQFNTQIDKLKFIDDYVHTAVDEGTVIVRVGWEFEEEYELRPVMDMNGMPMLDELGSVVMEEVAITVKNQPTVEVCNYTNVVFDPTCEGNLDKAEFIGYTFETSMAELEKSGLYRNLDQIEVNNNESAFSDNDSHYQADEDRESFSFSDKSRKKLQAYEYWGYWDINDDGTTVPIVATWVGSTMIRLEENPFPDGKPPFVVAQYLPVRRSIYGEPEGVLIEDNQKVVGAVMRGMIDTMARSAAGQKGYAKGTLDLTNKRKFDRGEDYEFNPGTDPRSAFYDHVYPELPQSASVMLQMMQEEAEQLTGVRPFNQQETDLSKARSAGARGPMDAGSKRENAILRRLAAGVERIGRKVISMNAAWLTPDTVVRVTENEFIQPTPDDLAGNFDLRISISTAEADNEKASELAFMLQTMGNTMPQDFSQILLADIARLRKMYPLAQRIEEYTPPPPSESELMMQQMQMMMQQLQIQKVEIENMKKQADAALVQAKTQSEFVSQAKVAADTDKVNLDFVEQEAGIQHARQVDVITAQAKAQAEMKVVEAGLDVMKERAMPKLTAEKRR